MRDWGEEEAVHGANERRFDSACGLLGPYRKGESMQCEYEDWGLDGAKLEQFLKLFQVASRSYEHSRTMRSKLEFMATHALELKRLSNGYDNCSSQDAQDSHLRAMREYWSALEGGFKDVRGFFLGLTRKHDEAKHGDPDVTARWVKELEILQQQGFEFGYTEGWGFCKFPPIRIEITDRIREAVSYADDIDSLDFPDLALSFTGKWGIDGEWRVEPIEEQDGAFHPHVRTSGLVCLGDREGVLRRAFERGSLHTFFSDFWRLLCTYNPDSPIHALDIWTSFECESCGRRHPISQREHCENCGRSVCEESLFSPDDLSGGVDYGGCRACTRTCETCGSRHLSTAHCDRCGVEICPNCRPTARCQQCDNMCDGCGRTSFVGCFTCEVCGCRTCEGCGSEPRCYRCAERAVTPELESSNEGSIERV